MPRAGCANASAAATPAQVDTEGVGGTRGSSFVTHLPAEMGCEEEGRDKCRAFTTGTSRLASGLGYPADALGFFGAARQR
jgi:hypothetical protein